MWSRLTRSVPMLSQAAQQAHGANAQMQAQARRRIAVLGIGTVAAGAGVALGASSFSGLSVAQCARGYTSSTPTPILSSAKIHARLTSPSERTTQVHRGVVKEVHSNQYAANAAIEDTLAIAATISAPGGGMLLGCFDGHSGGAASRWCSEELLPYLQYYRWSNRTSSLVHPRAFLEADHHFLELALRDGRTAAGLSGACLNVAHISGTQVRTANAGDCRTIVGRRVLRAGSTPAAPLYKYQAVELTTDHQIDTNHLERERLLRDHPDETDIISNNRVKGRLQPTRGFGDGFYKRREYYTARTLSRPYAMWTPPYTTVEPDITQYELQPEDEFVVMATDGLFQDLNSQQVVEFVGDWLALQAAENARLAKSSFFGSSSPAPTYCANASTYLIKSALTSASEHAVGRRRKENENLSWILQLPTENKRSYHDDISIMVAFFDHNAGYPSDAPVLSSASGPPVPPTLARALSLHLKPPPGALGAALAHNDGTTPIKIAPIQPTAGEAPVVQIKSNL